MGIEVVAPPCCGGLRHRAVWARRHTRSSTTKFSRETKGNMVLQLSTYSDLLATVHQKVPETAYVVTPGTEDLQLVALTKARR